MLGKASFCSRREHLSLLFGYAVEGLILVGKVGHLSTYSSSHFNCSPSVSSISATGRSCSASARYFVVALAVRIRSPVGLGRWSRSSGRMHVAFCVDIASFTVGLVDSIKYWVMGEFHLQRNSELQASEFVYLPEVCDLPSLHYPRCSSSQQNLKSPEHAWVFLFVWI